MPAVKYFDMQASVMVLRWYFDVAIRTAAPVPDLESLVCLRGLTPPFLEHRKRPLVARQPFIAAEDQRRVTQS